MEPPLATHRTFSLIAANNHARVCLKLNHGIFIPYFPFIIKIKISRIIPISKIFDYIAR